MTTTQDITTPRQQATAMALGFFDGLHLGHRAVIRRMTVLAQAENLIPAVFTFSPDGGIPASKNGLTLLQTEGHKELLLEELGVQELVTPDFSAFMGMSPQQYVHGLLHGVLRARVLVCGENYRFGHAAAAGVAQLRELAEQDGIRVVTIPPVLYQDRPVSSTRIRQALRDGDPQLAEAMLGTPFSIQGKVLPGKQLGRTLHSPTMNQNIPPDFTIPAYGVYLSRASTPLGDYWGVTSIGVRPTVNGTGVNCETYLIGFSGDLYGQTVAVALREWLRPEYRFPDIATLAAQIQVDIQTAKERLRRYGY